MTVLPPMLELKNICVHYGNIAAVRGVSLCIEEGEVVALLGANGAGKTSLLRAVSGLVPATGEIIFRGKNLHGFAPHERAVAGITHVPEGRGLFGNLTVQENLRLAAWRRKKGAELELDFESVLAYFPKLRSRLAHYAGTLSGGEQQMVAIGRALMSRGRLLLLDEPSMGLSPRLVEEIYDILARIKSDGVTILLVEQNAHAALGLASRGYVLETGKVTIIGSKEELLSNPSLKEAYLG